MRLSLLKDFFQHRPGRKSSNRFYFYFCCGKRLWSWVELSTNRWIIV